VDEDLAAQLERVRLESGTLYAIISAVGSSVDLGRVLAGIVDLLTEATGCHACFVYLREGERLRLRAASPVFAHLVGQIELGDDEGLTGWVASHNRPAFIRENAMADPRMKYVPELEEERFQSLVAVPIPARTGEALGVVVLHTAAPREFDRSALNFLAHVAALVAGAIENARLFEDARRRVQTLTGLAELSERIAAAGGREELADVVTAGVRDLLGAELSQLYRFEPGGRLALAATHPPRAPSPWPRAEAAAVLLDVLGRRGRGAPRPAPIGLLAAPLAVGDEDLGVLVAVAEEERGAFGDADDELLRAVANQVALGLQKVELIERLTAENLVRDVFDALGEGAADVAEARARRLGFALERPHAVVQGQAARGRDGPWSVAGERVEAGLRAASPGALCDAGREQLRALMPLEDRAGDAGLAQLRETLDDLAAAEGAALGVSGVRRGAADGGRGLQEAADASAIALALAPAGGALAFDELGAYKYLVHLRPDDAPRDRCREAVERLLDYDRRRRTHLVDTLERYLRDRRNVASTARALFIHPNTLRQRLDRIQRLSGLDLAREDLLSLELAVKLVRLRAAGGDGR
jgi:GAF domain-containing protein